MATRSPVIRLVEFVRHDRLQYLAERESGSDYANETEAATTGPVCNYVRRAIERGRRTGEALTTRTGNARERSGCSSRQGRRPACSPSRAS
jgi:hypothetical protein